MSRQHEELPSGTVTFLFTDVVGSTALWDSRPADMAVALEAVELIIEWHVRECGGHLLRSHGEGDSTLSVFSNAVLAVEAAVAAIRAIAEGEFPNGIELPVRSSIHSGEAQGRDGGYFGGTLNRAARVRDLAHGGQILVSDATAHLVDGLLDDDLTLQDLGVHPLRGLARPERIHQVCHPALGSDFPAIATEAGPLAPLPTGSDVPLPSALGMFRSGPFAGRDEQLARLSSGWERVTRAGPGLTVIGGEPGIGKTRLVAEFASSLRARGVTVLVGRCTEDPLRPYEPFADALFSYGVNAGVDDLPARLGRFSEPLSLIVPELAGPSMLAGSGRRADRNGADEDRAVFLDAIVAFLAALTVDVPAVLVMEDLHWATEATLVALRNVLQAPVTIPLLIIGTYRDTELDRQHPFAATLADLRRDERVQRLSLRGLDESAIAAWLAAHDHPDPSLDMARILRDQTNGNPFFVGEILRHLAETENEQTLPEGVREVVGRRLSSLGDSGVKVLRAAAVLGPTFSFDVLQRIPSAADHIDPLLDALDAATAAKLIVEVRDGTSGEYSFAHALVRQTVYEELSSPRRTRLHAQALIAIEQVHGASPRWLPALAHHAIEAATATDLDTVATHVHRAAVAALERYSGDEAINLSRRGLEVLQLGAPSPGREARLLTTLGRGLLMTDSPDQGRTALRRALELARNIGDAVAFAEAAEAVFFWETSVGAPNDVQISLLEEALDLIGDQDPGLRSELLADLTQAVLYGRNDFGLADRYSAEAISCADSLNDPAARLWPLMSRIGLLWGTARHDEQLELFRVIDDLMVDMDDMSRALEVGLGRVRLGYQVGESELRSGLVPMVDELAKVEPGPASYWRAFLALLDGDLDAAAQHNAIGLSESRRPVRVALGMAQTFVILREQGRLREFIDEIEVTVESTPGLASYGVALAMGRAEIGDHDDAARRLEDLADRGFHNLPSDMTFPVSLFLTAEVIARLEAREHVEQLRVLLEPFRGTGVVLGFNGAVMGSADRALGQLAAVEGRLDDAFDHYERAVGFEQRIGAPALVARTRYWQARALLGGPTDRADHGCEVLALALDAAKSRGMVGLVAELEALSSEASCPGRG